MESLASIARALGGKIEGGQVSAPGPGHSPRDNSLRVKLSPSAPEGFMVHSLSGDDPLECRDYVRACLGWERPARFGKPGNASIRYTSSEPDHDRLAKIDRARETWIEARNLRGTAAERYLNSRGLHPSDDVAVRDLRFHPANPWYDESCGCTIRVPAMIAAFRSIATGDLTGIHRTRLSDDGRKLDRRMLGRAGGSAVMLSGPAGESLTVGEGIETCLSAWQLGFRDVWAMGSVGAIAALPLIPGVRRLTLLAETGDGGASARAVDIVGQRYGATGREVLVLRPAGGGDLNDALMRCAA